MQKKLTIRKPITAYILLMISISISVFLGRLFWWKDLVSIRGPLGLFAIPMVCPFILIGLLILIVSSGLLALSFIQTRSPIPTLILIVGIFIACQIPMPARPDTPEKRYFLRYRPDFEYVVNLARNEQLTPGLLECRSGFYPPQGFEHVSIEGCIYVENLSTDAGFRVVFNPLEPYYHPVVYIDHPNTKQPCGNDAVVEQKIDEHWYVCQVEWS